MLLVRQGMQDQAFAEVSPPLLRNTRQYVQDLAAYREQATGNYRLYLARDYSRGATIYAESCAFCHGPNGQGPDAKKLRIPPAHLAAIRAQRSYLETILLNGVDGTAMPRFGYFDAAQRGAVLDYLVRLYGVVGLPPQASQPVSPAAMKEVQAIWAQTCSRCHGEDGSGRAGR